MAVAVTAAVVMAVARAAGVIALKKGSGKNPEKSSQ